MKFPSLVKKQFCKTPVEVTIYGDEITEGMKTEIRFAEKLNIKVRYISENDLRKSEVKNDKVKKN